MTTSKTGLFLVLCSFLSAACADIGATDEGYWTDVRFVPADGEPVSIGAFDAEVQELSIQTDLAAYGDGVKVFMPDAAAAVAIGPGNISLDGVQAGDAFEVYSILPGSGEDPATRQLAGTIDFTLDVVAHDPNEVQLYEVEGGYTMVCEFYGNPGYQDYWNHGCYFCHDDWVNYESYYWCW